MKHLFRYYNLLLVIAFTLPGCWPNKKPLDVVVDSNSVKSIYEHLEPDEYNEKTLVVFDIDNTTFRPIGHLGSDEWFYELVKQKVMKGVGVQEAIDSTIPLYFYVQNNVEVVPVESDTVPLILNLQDHGVRTIALTARSFDLVYLTIKQLDSIGITFGNNLPHECPMKFGDGCHAIYIDGALFVGGHDKGKVLMEWLKVIKYRPNKVIFIDDRLPNILAVERAVHRAGISFVGIRYGHLDEHAKTMILKDEEKEFERFIKKHPGYPGSTQVSDRRVPW